MQHHSGFRRGTRSKFRKDQSTKGKISLRKFFQEFVPGDKVVLKAESSYHKGMYFPRFHGRSCMVMGKRGDCYEVLLKDGRKEKLLIVHPVHLVRSE